MSGFSLPRFAKTGGKTQKFAENEVAESPKTASPSFFKSLKHRLGKPSRGSQSFDKDDPEATEDKSYFSKTTGTATMARNINAFAWGAEVKSRVMQAGHSSTLQECSVDGDLDGVKRLLNLGEDVDGIDEDGNTGLHMAAESGAEEVVRFLVGRGANANAVNEEGDSPLHKATVNNYVNIISLLVAGNADVNIQNVTGWTSLHEAACNGRLEVAQTLLHLGADVHRRTKEGDTALHKAARWGRVEIVKLLLLVGADARAKDKLGREARQRTNVEEIVQLLKAHKQEQSRAEENHSRRSSQSSPKKAAWSETSSTTEFDDEEDDEWNVADQRELYEVQWTLFASNKNPERKISYSDVPWPGMSTSPADIVQVVLYGVSTPEEKRKRLRSELLRWHPDKFQASFGRNLKPGDADQIMAKVKEISQAINETSK